MSDYPKWVQRAPDIGAVLCLTADEEKQLLADWNAELVSEKPVGKKKAAESVAE